MNYTLITGATSDIGGAIVRELSKSRPLILHGRDPEKLQQVLAQCAPGPHLTWTYDLGQIDTLQAPFEAFVKASGVTIEGFLHAAGVVELLAVKAFDIKTIQHVLNVNALSAILLTSSLLKARIAGKSMKSIVFISSISGFVGARGMSLYGTSKGMLNAFTRSAAVELAHSHVRINTICPAAVKTKMASTILSDPVLNAAMEARHPLGVGVPEDIVGLVEFLLSERSRWMTGQNIVIDGGALCDFK